MEPGRLHIAESALKPGERKLAGDMQTWLGLSPVAKVRKLAS